MRFSDFKDLYEARMGKRELNNVQTPMDFTIGFEFEMVVSDDAIEDWKNDFDQASSETHVDDFTTDECTVMVLEDKVDEVSSYPVNVHHKYHANEKNPNKWTIEPDGSIKPQGAEIVSPVFTDLEEAFMEMESIFSFTDQTIYTNESTGLHVNIGTFDMNDVDVMKLLVFMNEKHVLETFGRENNEYTRPILIDLIRKLESDKQSKPTMSHRQLVTGMQNFILAGKKNFSFNVEKLIKNGYLEFRLIGGDYTDRLDDVKLTIQRFIRALEIARNPNAYKNEYIKKIRKIFDLSNYDEYTSNAPKDNLTLRAISILRTISGGKWARLQSSYPSIHRITTNPKDFLHVVFGIIEDNENELSAKEKTEIRAVFNDINNKSSTNLSDKDKKDLGFYLATHTNNKNNAKLLISLVNLIK